MKRTLFGAAVIAALFGATAIAQQDQSGCAQMIQPGQQQSSTVQVPPEQQPAVTGQVQNKDTCQQIYGGSGQAGETMPAPEAQVQQAPVEQPQVQQPVEQQPIIQAPAPAVTAPPREVREREHRDHMRGVMVTAGGGVEGYTGTLGDAIRIGPSWGVNLGVKPTRVLGLELGYSGATNELRGVNIASGPDLIRNGGTALATLGLSATRIQPYVLAGVGINHYTVRAATPDFRSDTSGSVPVGLGIRAHLGHFTADLRGNYSMLFNQDFAPMVNSTTGTRFFNDARWNGTLQIGSTF